MQTAAKHPRDASGRGPATACSVRSVKPYARTVCDSAASQQRGASLSGHLIQVQARRAQRRGRNRGSCYLQIPTKQVRVNAPSMAAPGASAVAHTQGQAGGTCRFVDASHISMERGRRTDPYGSPTEARRTRWGAGASNLHAERQHEERGAHLSRTEESRSWDEHRDQQEGTTNSLTETSGSGRGWEGGRRRE